MGPRRRAGDAGRDDRGSRRHEPGPDPSNCTRVSAAPVLVVHGDEDQTASPSIAAMLAAATGGELVTIVGGGHLLHGRQPVVVNHLIKRFVDQVCR